MEGLGLVQEATEGLDSEPQTRAERRPDAQLPAPHERREPAATEERADHDERDPGATPPVRRVATGEGQDRPEHHDQGAEHPDLGLAPVGLDIPEAAPARPRLELRFDQTPPRGERGVVGAELHLVAPAERGGQRSGQRALLDEPDGASVFLDEVDRAVDGGLDEPRDLVLRPHLLGVEQPALGRRELARRGELGGGHLLELALVEPHLADGTASTGPRRVGDAARADALAPGSPHEPRRAEAPRRSPWSPRRAPGARARSRGPGAPTLVARAAPASR